MGRYALVVGVGGYDDERFSQLRSPSHDVDRLSKLLRDPAVGSFDKVVELTDPNDRELRRAIAETTADRTREDLVLIYLSCHGVKDRGGSLHFAAKDTEEKYLTATAVPASYVNNQLERCTAGGRVLLLDCCFSAAMVPGFAAKASDQPLSGEFGGHGYVVITATNQYEYAFEPEAVVPEDEAPSVFTDAVIEALTSTDADRDGDGFISTDDLYEYVHRAVRDRTSQTPTRFAHMLQGTIKIAYAPGSDTRREVAQSTPITTSSAVHRGSHSDRDRTRPAYVFRASNYIDFDEWRESPARNYSVDSAITGAWQRFLNYLRVAMKALGDPEYQEDDKLIDRIAAMFDAGAATTVSLRRAAVASNAAQSAHGSTAPGKPTRLDRRRLNHFIDDLESVARDVDQRLDVTPPAITDLMEDLPPHNVEADTLTRRAVEGLAQLSTYGERLCRALIAPPLEPSHVDSDPPKARANPPRDVPLEKSLERLARETRDPAWGIPTRDIALLRDRAGPGIITDRASLEAHLAELAELAAELEEKARETHRVRVQGRRSTAGELVGFVAVMTMALAAFAGFIVLVSAGPTAVGLRYHAGDRFQVEHHAGIPGRTQFVWDLRASEEVTTDMRPDRSNRSSPRLAGFVRLDPDSSCERASVSWTLSASGRKLASGTARFDSGEPTETSLGTVSLPDGKLPETVRLTAVRKDSSGCGVELHWTRPGFG